MQAKIISTHTLDPKGIAEIKELWPTIQLDVQIKAVNLKPKYNPFFNQIWLDFDWLRSLFTTTVDVRCLAMTIKELRAAGVTSHIGMYDLVDADDVYDFYIAVPKTDKRAKANGFKTTLGWIFSHELIHGKEKNRGGPDRTHSMEEQGRLKELITYHLQRDELVKKVGLLSKIVSLLSILKKKPKLITEYILTQHYGVPHKRYTITGHHIGTDYAMPVGTPLVLPEQCKVTRIGFLPSSLGHWCEVQYKGRQLIMAHLEKSAKIGNRKPYQTIALSGNTGFSTGPHLHIEGWYNSMDRSKLTKRTWKTLTFNPLDIL